MDQSEMDFELIIGNLGEWDTPVQTGRYYPLLGVIAVDGWDGNWSETQMADILSHEFIHHLLYMKFREIYIRATLEREAISVGGALDNIRPRGEDLDLVIRVGIEKAWAYIAPVTKFAIKCALLQGEDGSDGNGVI